MCEGGGGGEGWGEGVYLLITLFSPQVVAASRKVSSKAPSMPEGIAVRSGAPEAVPVCSPGLEPPGHHTAEERAEGPQPLACATEGGWERAVLLLCIGLTLTFLCQ